MRRIQTGWKLMAVVLWLWEVVDTVRKRHYPQRTFHYLKHSWRIRLLSRALAKALGDSREASSWPGDRLAVGVEFSEKVERLTCLVNRENKVHGRVVALLK
jgi:hypothetical protein